MHYWFSQSDILNYYIITFGVFVDSSSLYSYLNGDEATLLTLCRWFSPETGLRTVSTSLKWNTFGWTMCGMWGWAAECSFKNSMSCRRRRQLTQGWDRQWVECLCREPWQHWSSLLVSWDIYKHPTRSLWKACEVFLILKTQRLPNCLHPRHWKNL